MRKSQTRLFGRMVIRIFVLALSVALSNVHARIRIGLMWLTSGVVLGSIGMLLSSVLRFQVLRNYAFPSIIHVIVDRTNRSRVAARRRVKVYEVVILVFCFDPRGRSCRARIVPAIHDPLINWPVSCCQDALLVLV
jgi:hypothetical protein